MRASFRRTLLTAPFVALAVAACASRAGQPVQVAVAPTIVIPEDLLSSATSLALSVYDTSTGAACDPSGQTTGITSDTTKVASQSLGTANCTNGAKFCGALTITQSDDSLVFMALATNASGAEIAYGCATATVNQDTLDVSIAMVHYLPPATCGNGVIELTEQCDPPGSGTDLVCDSSCHSKEELLSIGATAPQGPTALLWPAESSAEGNLLAFFTDEVSANPTHYQVGLRVMSPTLEAVSAPPAASTAILAPNTANGPFPPSAIAGDQQLPAAAFENGTYWYAFTDDSTNGDPDIHLRSFDSSLSFDIAQSINGAGGAGEANVQTDPAIAVGPNGVLFIAWQDVSGPNAGQIMGRTFTPGSPGTLGTENQLSTGSGNENVVVAATGTGWLAVFDDGSQVKMRVVDTNGTPSGAEIPVSDATHTGTQDHPGVAVLSDGRAAVVWCDHSATNGADIFVQRYDQNLTAVSGDQGAAINDLVTAGDQTSPAIAGTSAAGGSFVAAWIDTASGNVQGRVLDGTTGFDFNPITGQTTEFTATLAASITRENPVVVIGGAGPSVAIGWDEGPGTGVYARRFPAPTQ